MPIIAVLGAGIMASGIILNLQKAGYHLNLYNRSIEKLFSLKSKSDFICSTPADAASGADIIISLISNDNVSKEIWFGANGVIQTAAKNTYCIEMSTLSVEYINEWSKRLLDNGLRPIDCPVTGSKYGAENGTLTLFFGGQREYLNDLRDVFKNISSEIFYIGQSSSGIKFKLIYNMLNCTMLNALGEAVSLSKSSGLSIKIVEEILTVCGWCKIMADAKINKMINESFNEVTCSVENISKDMLYACQYASSLSVSVPVAHTAANQYKKLNDKGFGYYDMSAIVESSRG